MSKFVYIIDAGNGDDFSIDMFGHGAFIIGLGRHTPGRHQKNQRIQFTQIRWSFFFYFGFLLALVI